MDTFSQSERLNKFVAARQKKQSLHAVKVRAWHDDRRKNVFAADTSFDSFRSQVID